MASQLAREAGAYAIGTGRAAARQTALDFGAQEFVDLDNDALEDVGKVDLVFDVLGGDIAKRSAGVIRAGGTLVTVTGPTEARPSGGMTVDFVVIPDSAQLSELVQRVRVGRLRTTSAAWLPSTMRLPPSSGPSGSRERRSSALVREALS
jgi:NADPH:quinone reductase-like Zn-dependent oxidoreductase